MKVFISWSGDRSHRVAQLLHDWLNLVIQSLEPWLSSSDIERGSQWSNKINKELEASSQGIFCLTAENKTAPWILFEAGSLAKGQETSRVYTLLIDVPPADITGPLVQFNHTQPNKTEMKLLVSNLNDRLSEKRLSDAVLSRAFENAWPKFEADFKQILADTEATSTAKDPRTEKEIMYEVLDLVRNFDKRISKLEKLPPPTASRDAGSMTFSEFKKAFKPEILGPTLVREHKYYGGGVSDSELIFAEIRNSVAHGLSNEEILTSILKKFPYLNAEETTHQIDRYRDAIDLN